MFDEKYIKNEYNQLIDFKSLITSSDCSKLDTFVYNMLKDLFSSATLASLEFAIKKEMERDREHGSGESQTMAKFFIDKPPISIKSIYGAWHVAENKIDYMVEFKFNDNLVSRGRKAYGYVKNVINYFNEEFISYTKEIEVHNLRIYFNKLSYKELDNNDYFKTVEGERKYKMQSIVTAFRYDIKVSEIIPNTRSYAEIEAENLSDFESSLLND